MTRQAKTPRQRAEEALAVATRQAKRLQDQHAKLTAELERVGLERNAAFTRRDYLAKNPDLAQPAATIPTTQENPS